MARLNPRLSALDALRLADLPGRSGDARKSRPAHPLLICYPQPGKAKSALVLSAFAKGCGASLKTSTASALDAGAVAFYGVVGIEHLFREAVAKGREFYYGDNAYFDVTRERFFRFTRNALQPATLFAAPDHARRERQGIRVEPWRKGGEHIVVVEQSAHFLKTFGAGEDWLERTLASLQQHTDRPVMVRRWQRDKKGSSASFPAALKNAWALVTYMSAAANEALLAGVPVFVSGPCAASSLACSDMTMIESPLRPEGREDWAASLAASQWTLDEMKEGMAWRTLDAHDERS